MASRLGRRFVSQLTRNVRPQAMGRSAGRRMMSSNAHAEQGSKSDLAWQIGSAAIFGPAAIYLLMPQGKDKAHATASSHKSEHKKSEPETSTAAPLKDDEGTEAPAHEVQASIQQAYNEDSPKDAQEHEEQTATGKSSDAQPITDDEGTTASASEIKESTEKAFKEDSPADAQAAEEQDPKETKSSVPKGSAPEDAPVDGKEKPSKDEHPGTLQREDDTGRADQGEARERAQSGQDPKHAAKDQ
ncbi:hypothetical protein K474DRAFT_1699891 [Panus rudis PR-1116 ss-1]|nr:hypothetical protein K474DRAFT_1699891 [Panus rudis PR-1116 ss-1]